MAFESKNMEEMMSFVANVDAKKQIRLSLLQRLSRKERPRQSQLD
jgi:hypothetical protein